MTGPGWPDVRGWVAVGFFTLACVVLWMIRENPALLANASFMQLVGPLVGGGGLGLIVAFFFGASKGAQESRETAGKAMDIAAAAQASAAAATAANVEPEKME